MIIMLEISVERSTGKFASKDDVANELIGLVDGQTLYVEESEYEVTCHHDDRELMGCEPATDRWAYKQLASASAASIAALPSTMILSAPARLAASCARSSG